MALIGVHLVFIGYLLAEITNLLAMIREKGTNPQNIFDSRLNQKPGVKTRVNLKRVSMRHKNSFLSHFFGFINTLTKWHPISK
jgi:hypothetical protein